jgi:hypothetical protein
MKIPVCLFAGDTKRLKLGLFQTLGILHCMQIELCLVLRSNTFLRDSMNDNHFISKTNYF